MKVEHHLTPADKESIERRLRDFVPAEVFDAHSHLIHGAHYAPQPPNPFVKPDEVLGIDAYAEALGRWLPARRVGSLCFGYPSRGGDCAAINEWMAAEVGKDRACSRSLYLVKPTEESGQVAYELQRNRHIGLKPYASFAARDDFYHAEIEEYAPEWMWELCHETSGILMLHIVRDRAIADESNQKALRRLCRAYPNCQLVLAHIARSFNYRHALEGLEAIADLENAWVDTSSISESPAFRQAIKLLGPQRILFGSDYPVSDVRAKCTAIGDRTHWLYASEDPNLAAHMNTVGIESLLCLQEACEKEGLAGGEVQAIFHDNALRLLAPHLDRRAVAVTAERLCPTTLTS